jgi:hypothetical protein
VSDQRSFEILAQATTEQPRHVTAHNVSNERGRTRSVSARRGALRCSRLLACGDDFVRPPEATLPEARRDVKWF